DDVIGEKCERLGVAVRTAMFMKLAPLLDFPRRALVFRVGVDPFENFAIAFAGGELFAQRGDIKPKEIDDVLIEGRVVIELAVETGDVGAAFIDQPGKDGVTAETTARAATRAFGQIRCGEVA